MIRLVGLLKSYKKEALLAPLFKLLEAVFDLIIPIIVAIIIDQGISSGSKKIILIYGACMFLLAFLGIVVSIIAQYFAAKASVKVGSDLRDELFGKVQSFGYKNLDEIGESTLVNRITVDTLQVQTGLNFLLRLVLRSPFIIAGSTVAAFLINQRIGYVFLAVVIAIMLIVAIITKITIPRYEKIQDKKDTLYNITEDQLDGARVIRAFGREEDEYKLFRKENELLTKYQRKASKVSSTMTSLNYIAVNLGIIGILYYGGLNVKFGILTQGQIVALVNYALQILTEILKLNNLLLVVPKAIASNNRIKEVLKQDIAIKQKANKKASYKEEASIEFRNVSFSFDKHEEKMVLENISFEAHEGELIGIIGPTGSGKSVLLNLIPRYYDTTIGDVFVNGRNVRDYNVDNLRKFVAVAPQNISIFKGSILDNITFGNRKAKKEQISLALNVSESNNIISKKRDGLDEFLDENGKNLSGGQKQRISLARAVCKDTKILLIDDSISQLDNDTKEKVIKNLKAIYRDKLLIMATNKVSDIKSFDKIIVMEDGKISAIGTHSELMDTCQIYKDLAN